LIALLLSLLATGCAGYRLGPANGEKAGERSVQVQPFLNQTLEPRLADAVTQQVRKELQRDGTYRLATRDDGDLIMTGVIMHYTRKELSFVPSDISTVRDYRVAMEAQVTVRERSSGKVVLDRPVSGYTLIRVGTDLTSTDRQALPLLAADLAKNVTSLLAEGSW
jgi:hypothetical protein